MKKFIFAAFLTLFAACEFSDVTVDGCRTPNAPGGVSASAQSLSSIRVTWNSVSGADSYRVYCSPSSSGTYSYVGSSSSKSYTNTGLTASTTYYYKVKAVSNNCGESQFSSYDYATTLCNKPSAPSNVSALAQSSSSISVSWTSVSGTDYYQIYRSPSSSGTYSQVGSSSSTSYTDDGLSASTAYYYKISAVNSCGESTLSSYSSASTSCDLPSAPYNVSASAQSSSSISISWTSVSGADYYQVYGSTSSSGTYSQVGSSSSTSYTDDGLSASTAYYYKISAVNSCGESALSSYSPATTEALPQIERVLVSSGSFSTDGATIVTLTEDFYISKYPVTQAQYRAVMGNNPSYFSGDNKPVEMVTWQNAVAFCEAVGGFLPTEAQWEFAARGGNNSNGYIYSGSDNLDEVGWYWSNSSSGTKDVGLKNPNELGIYDMSGNVWEWTADWYQDNYPSGSMNPTGASSGSYRVVRGGSWRYYEVSCRVSDRSSYYPGNYDHYLGFRVAFPRN